MDAFSRLLAAIGQSLGKGLGQVGQTELEQRQRLETLEAQRKANISGQLLQTFTQLLQTQGIQEVEPGGIDAIKQAVTDLALGKIDSPAVQKAIDVFPKVAASANKLTVYRELATRDIDALAKLVYRADPEEAKRLLGAVGLGGMYGSFRSRGEILSTAEELGIQLTKEQIENLATQRKVMEAQIAKWAEEMKLTQAQTKQILDTLPLQVTKLQLEIAKGEKELARLDEYLDETIKGLKLDNLGKEVNIDKLKQEIKNLVLQGIKLEAETKETEARTKKIEAETKRVEVETKEIETRLKFLEDEYKIKLSKEGLELARAIYLARMTDPQAIKNILRGIPGLDFITSDEKTLDAVANGLADDVKKFIYERDLKISQEETKAVDSAIGAATKAANPSAARELAMMILPESMPKEKREMIANAAAFVNVFATGKMTVDLIKTLTEITPPKESQSGLLRIIYDSLAGMHDGTEEGRKQALARANAAVNTIKYIWSLNEETRDLQKLKLISEVELNNARAAHERVLAELGPKQLDLKWQEFKLDEWYKKEWIKINWAKLDLERLELLAKQAQVKDSTLQDLKTIADTANKLHDAAVGVLEERLRQLGFNECANELRKTESLSIVEAALGKQPGDCNNAVKLILNNPQDPKNEKVIRAIEGAQNAKLRAIELFNAVLGGEGLPTSPTPGAPTPGGAAPTTPGTGGRPSGTTPGGTTAPGGTSPGATGGALGSDFASGTKVAFNRIKEFGVKIPNDPKLAGAMVFVYGTEFGPWYNPFQVTEGAGVPMQEITIEEGGQKKKVKVPVGPDKGFQAVIDGADIRKKALAIDSAIAFGVAWIFPNEADKPGMLAKYIREDFRNSNPGLFRRAENFKSKTGYVDMVSVAAAYADMSLEKLGAPIRHTKAYTGLLRLLAQNDLDVLRMRNPLPPEQAKQRYLNMVRSDPKVLGELLEVVRKQSPNLTREKALEKALQMAEDLYDATRLSNIGRLVLGGGR